MTNINLKNFIVFDVAAGLLISAFIEVFDFHFADAQINKV